MKEKIMEKLEEGQKVLKSSLVIAAGIYAVLEEEYKKLTSLITSKDELIKKGEVKSEEIEKKIRELSEKIKEQVEVINKLQNTIQEKIKELSEKVSLKNPIITEEEAEKEVKETA